MSVTARPGRATECRPEDLHAGDPAGGGTRGRPEDPGAEGGAVASGGHAGQGRTPSEAARCGDAAELADLLQASRADTLATFEAYRQACPDLAVPCVPALNPPLWELGHIGWFQEFWIGRNPQRHLGLDADPDLPRPEGVRPGADALYHSSRVAHDHRWQLPLPDAEATVADLALQLADTLQRLESLSHDDTALYFHRLALMHEDMHHEAALYMAQALGLPIADPRWQHRPLAHARQGLCVPAGPWRLGQAVLPDDDRFPVPGQGPEPGPSAARRAIAGCLGFQFDNECGRRTETLPDGDIDSRVVRWDEYLPFVAAGGYRDPRFWSDVGWSWRCRQGQQAPRDLRPAGWGLLDERPPWAPGLLNGACAGAPHVGAADPGSPAAGLATPWPTALDAAPGGWEVWRHGRWGPLDLTLAACHLSAHEASAWCRWAGRRLPAEAEWEAAEAVHGAAFQWGEVWEWTATPFAPFEGFRPHPYRDYSAPWFDGRPVLRGASRFTQPRLRHPRYRNFFHAHRHDVPAGFRSCSATR